MASSLRKDVCCMLCQLDTYNNAKKKTLNGHYTNKIVSKAAVWLQNCFKTLKTILLTIQGSSDLICRSIIILDKILYFNFKLIISSVRATRGQGCVWWSGKQPHRWWHWAHIRTILRWDILNLLRLCFNFWNKFCHNFDFKISFALISYFFSILH